MLQKLQNNSSKHSNSTVRIEPRPRSENRRKHLERNWNSNRRIYIYIYPLGIHTLESWNFPLRLSPRSTRICQTSKGHGQEASVLRG